MVYIMEISSSNSIWK